MVGTVAAGPEAAEAEVALEAAEAEVAPGLGQAEVVEVPEAAGAREQAAVVTAEVEEEALAQSGPGVMCGLPETPRLADAWRPREHSPSAGRHLSLSSG